MPVSPLKAYVERVGKGLISPDSAQKKAVLSLQSLYEQILSLSRRAGWARKFLKKKPSAHDAIKGIYLYGGVGRGKSMLMDLFYECLPDTVKKRRVHFHAFMIEVHDYIHGCRSKGDFANGVNGILPLLAKHISVRSRVLCFDEFHITDVADAMILGRLFTSLFERGVVIVATSNWPPERLYEGGLQRDRFLPFITLLKNKMQIVHLDSPIDYRTQLLQSEGTYFWPLGEPTAAKLSEVFSKLTDDMPAAEESLIVKGRTIPVIAAKGVARFTFAQLCENPHGAEDYLAIAQKYSTIFLENIPKLGYDRRNEVKRLMMLIDAIYENRIKLIASADAPPDRLYRGYDHGFEFERTVSRLMEMQSETYLKSGVKIPDAVE